MSPLLSSPQRPAVVTFSSYLPQYHFDFVDSSLITNSQFIPRHIHHLEPLLASVYAMFLARRLMSSELIFHHQPLSFGKSPFRLLRLRHGTGYPIQCSIVEGDLDDLDNLMEYSALSCAWDDSDARGMINVDGRVLSISGRLHEALGNLRDRNEDTTLWTDAICIDQTNILERGHQVALMGRIYEHANNVIIWLGVTRPNANLLVSTLKRLQLKVSTQSFQQWQFRDDRWRDAWEELHGGDIPRGPFHRQLIDGLEELTETPWFTRVWTIQEVANAKRAQVQCSAGAIDARFLALAPWLLGHSIEERFQDVLDILPGPSREFSWWNENRALGTLLRKFKECQATDPRDRVYALVGIASDMASQAIQPDYSKSELRLVKDTCRHLFGKEHFAALSSLQRIEDLQKDIPRWAGACLEEKMVWRDKSEDLERFLERQEQVEGTDGIVKFASFSLGQSTLALLLTKVNNPKKFKPKLFREAVWLGSDAFDFLISTFTDKNGNLESLLLAAAEAGEDAMDMIYQKCEIPAGIANDMNVHMTGVPVPVVERLYFERWRHELGISESTTVKIAQGGLDLLKIFLWGKTGKLQITEAVLRQAKLDSVSYSLLKTMRSSEVNVSEEEAIQAIKGGPDTLRRCLEKPGTNFQVTETILRAAMLSGADVTEILFSKRESEVNMLQEVQEIYQLRDDLREHVLEILGRTEHTTMLREALARYENLNTSELIGSATAALSETTDVVQWLRSAGVCVSRWRTVHELLKELIRGGKCLANPSSEGNGLEFRGLSGGDVDVEEWINLTNNARA